MTDRSPLISILIPSYKPRHFEIALTSALAQTWENKEIIVSDDCPSAAIAEICARYPGIKYSRNPNPGAQNNALRLIGLAQGEFVKFLLDDDLLHPLCIGQMAAAFASVPSATLVFSPRDLIDADNRVIQRPRAFQVKDPVTVIPGAQLLHRCIADALNHVGELTTVMMRKRDIVDAAGRPTLFEFHGTAVAGLGDMSAWINLCERGDAIYFAEPLSYFRMHPDANTSTTHTAVYRAGVTDWLIFADFALRDPRFSRQDRLKCLGKLRERLQRKLPLIPDLETELRQVERWIAEVSAT
jgi:glycosyltransferase involved in cell wall biosynthesis